MPEKPIGVVVRAREAPALLDTIQEAEQLGIPAVWMTSGGGVDCIPAFAAAALKTQTVKFGTAVVQTYPRHPMVLAHECRVIAQLAPGRFRLGVGPSHRPMMESMGIPFRSPMGNLREYVTILKGLLKEGEVAFDGEHYRTHLRDTDPVDVPVMVSALQRGSFEMAGEMADGAISWVCPASYLKDVALPAMRETAQKAERPPPPLITHAPVCVHDDPGEMREAVREQIMNPRLPFYQRMFRDAGFPEAFEGKWSDGMIDAVVVSGNEADVAARLEGLLAIGSAELLVSIVPAGKDQDASYARTLRLLGAAASGQQ